MGYCRSNPVSFWDPSGMRIECAGNDPQEEKEIIERMHEFANESTVFNVVFSYLDNSDKTFYVSYDKTTKVSTGNGVVESAAGEYNHTRHTLTFNSELPDAKTITIAEEMYHAMQLNVPWIFTNDENLEFEAKTFAIIASAQASLDNSLGLKEPYYESLSDRALHDRRPFFTGKEYVTYGNVFQRENQLMNNGSSSSFNEYCKPVTRVPFLLQLILKNAKPLSNL